MFGKRQSCAHSLPPCFFAFFFVDRFICSVLWLIGGSILAVTDFLNGDAERVLWWSPQTSRQPCLARLEHPRPQTRSAAVQLGEGDSAPSISTEPLFTSARLVCPLRLLP